MVTFIPSTAFVQQQETTIRQDCYFDQEPTHFEHIPFAWVLNTPDPCSCLSLRLGGAFTFMPQRTFVPYRFYTTPYFTSNASLIQDFFGCEKDNRRNLQSLQHTTTPCALSTFTPSPIFEYYYTVYDMELSNPYSKCSPEAILPTSLIKTEIYYNRDSWTTPNDETTLNYHTFSNNATCPIDKDATIIDGTINVDNTGTKDATFNQDSTTKDDITTEDAIDSDKANAEYRAKERGPNDVDDYWTYIFKSFNVLTPQPTIPLFTHTNGGQSSSNILESPEELLPCVPFHNVTKVQWQNEVCSNDKEPPYSKEYYYTLYYSHLNCRKFRKSGVGGDITYAGTCTACFYWNHDLGHIGCNKCT
ncbi:uncharacterized protein [Amphiura filiformis]|uniref:uncharacterized protein n=1 Tax=Amphiura filiformis TaxID=82378 RepID=UPI003B20BFBB